MKNKIEDLRNHLFATLEALQDKEDPMEIDRARAVADVARVIVETAKAETRHVQMIGGLGGTDFIPSEPRKSLRMNGSTPPALSDYVEERT